MDREKEFATVIDHFVFPNREHQKKINKKNRCKRRRKERRTGLFFALHFSWNMMENKLNMCVHYCYFLVSSSGGKNKRLRHPTHVRILIVRQCWHSTRWYISSKQTDRHTETRKTNKEIKWVKNESATRGIRQKMKKKSVTWVYKRLICYNLLMREELLGWKKIGANLKEKKRERKR